MKYEVHRILRLTLNPDLSRMQSHEQHPTAPAFRKVSGSSTSAMASGSVSSLRTCLAGGVGFWGGFPEVRVAPFSGGSLGLSYFGVHSGAPDMRRYHIQSAHAKRGVAARSGSPKQAHEAYKGTSPRGTSKTSTAMSVFTWFSMPTLGRASYGSRTLLHGIRHNLCCV